MTARGTAPGVHTTGFVALDLLVVDGAASAHAGGSAANIAINLALLGWPARVTGLLGGDDAGRAVVEDLRRHGVETSGLDLDAGARTPVVVHEVRDGRHRFRFSCPSCGRGYAKHRPLPAERAAASGPCDVFVFDRTSVYAVAAAEKARRDGALVVFEPGTPGRAAAFRQAVETADVFRRSHDLDDRLPDRLSESPPCLEIVGHGADGVRWRGRWRSESFPDWQAAPAEATAARDVVDPGGAGDWLTAGLVDSIVNGRLVADAIAQGQRLASLSCGFPGTRGWNADHAGRAHFELLTGRRTDGHQAYALRTTRDGECAAWFCDSAADRSQNAAT